VTPKHLSAAAALLLLASVVAGCNTVAGFGEDTQAAGRGITNAADQTKTSIDEGTSSPPGCATPLHQDLPGGTDYHGPPVAGCPAPY
jgi:predicted small secreted protein